MKWTPQQLQAIQTTGVSLLVSAAAGSGKTAVLAERCAYLVCDAPQTCDVDELLVVTFTNATADEMRSRIELALRRRMDDSDDPRLSRQLLLLGRAHINTLHSFCSTFLRRHFHLLGLDPNFRVLDQQEVDLLKQEIAREVLDDRYEHKDSAAFQSFVDCYGNGNDRIVLHHMLNVYELMSSMVNPKQWVADSIARIDEARRSGKLIDTAMGREIGEVIGRWLEDINRRLVQLAERISTIDGLDPYGEYVNDLLAAAHLWKDEFSKGRFDKLAGQVTEFEPAKLPTIRQPPPEKEAIQAEIGYLRKEMREGPVASLCRFTEKQWREGLDAIIRPVRILFELVEGFARQFARAKRELRALDFSDLERFTLRILRENPDELLLEPSAVARSYHRQFKHLLVDEYQDINEVQDAILHLLSQESRASNQSQNLFCVGDVKQSIYRFRLAQPWRFLEKYDRFRKDKNGQVIDLGANFRSRGPLLEVINGVFRRLMSRQAVEIEYDRSQHLVPQAQYPKQSAGIEFSGSPIEMHLLPAPPRMMSDDEGAEGSASELDRTEREAVFVAQRIRQLVNSGVNVAAKSEDGSLGLRPIQNRDIVILLRSVKHRSEQFAQALRASGIAVHSDSASGFFESTEIRDMLALLRVLDNRRQDIPLAAVLRSPLSGLPEADDGLARIRLADPEIPFHEAVVQYAAQRDDELAAYLRSFLDDLDQWRQMARQCPIAELIWHVYDRTGYLAFCSGMEDGPQRVANLIEFHQRAKQFGTFQRQGLTRFLGFLESLIEHSDLELPSITSQADDVVRVMSVHRAKGLEFPVVIVPDLGKNHNFRDAQGQILADRQAGIGLSVADQQRRVRYPSLAQVLVQERIKKQTMAEEMRVLYVAMTRAREHLILVGTCREDDPARWTEEWSKHSGPFPPERVLASRTMLDWLGPAAASMEGAKDKHRIEVTFHSEDEIAKWSVASERRETPSDQQENLAKLRPLNPAPPVDPQVQRLTAALTTSYPYRDFTILPAARSVGSLTREKEWATAEHVYARDAVGTSENLKTPRWASEDQYPSAAEIGTATHTVLEQLDFSRRCDRDDIQLQINDMLRRKVFTTELSATVDMDAILWLISTPLGKALQRNGNRLWRELPVYYPQVSTCSAGKLQPLDRVMVRGKIDVLIPDAGGLLIADYKTDRVTAQTVDARVEYYRPQLASYRDAVSAIVGEPVKSTLLAFLSPRIIREI
ncbi:MAG TPA: helicase-exonuclease AddAB subunit AddA [Tepidisphaeraceae bacterium]|nr:helicase-exonuclease AddAB subunit AddA [Tepidisphaeraceae bacterium]